ncbi:MAG: PQQ-dependent sugar dehydrogenase [Pseudomonadales bacterium]|jgi:glucose/arabinose dehydrogenase|nr:PQQ-dependent sugar dehydrogenase [Pseudomonadales bacterium]
MLRSSASRLAILAALLILGVCARAEPDVGHLRVPAGFAVELVTDELANARQLQLGADGTLFAGTRSDGRVWAWRDGRAHAIAEGLTMPSGIALRDGDLYIGAVDTIYRLDDIEARLEDPPAPVVVTAELPSDGHHGWKHLEFAPDGTLWVPVGAPCNICEPDAPYMSLLRMDADSGAWTIAARGIRNTVGFDFDPATGALWFTDNGRDWLGDDTPPCELNRLDPQATAVPHFGYPHVHGRDVIDPEFGAGRSPAEFVLPEHEFGAHTAPLGVAFYDGASFPPAYAGALFVAQHGSWNRSSKVGYQVVVAFLEDGEVRRVEPFLTGFLDGERVRGRPVDVLVDHDGSLLVSDDQQGAVYRVRWVGETITAR